MRPRPAFAGIDVAFAKEKHLPVVVSRWHEERLVPEPLSTLPFSPPVGQGNVASCDPNEVEEFASKTLDYLHRIEDKLDVQIVRIGIDAPSAPRRNEASRRAAEKALDESGITCFTTPSKAEFETIRNKVEEHLRAGGRESNLPHANQLWMQVGFALFEKLPELAECIEVYPQATVRKLNAGAKHKSAAGAVRHQLKATARHTGWPSERPEEPDLEEIAFGLDDDRLDAYLAAWAAARKKEERIGYGTPPDDVIWIPRIPDPEDEE